MMGVPHITEDYRKLIFMEYQTGASFVNFPFTVFQVNQLMNKFASMQVYKFANLQH
jgi:hypothetical protein